jgi:HPr kinase/phosphorylase
MRVLNTGVLILGESGTGKSECAFSLIRKGHQLVADDVVEVFVKEGVLRGRPTDFTRGLMEIRGMGIVDAGAMFGEEVLCSESSIDLCVELNESAAVDRFGAAETRALARPVSTSEVCFSDACKRWFSQPC